MSTDAIIVGDSNKFHPLWLEYCLGDIRRRTWLPKHFVILVNTWANSWSRDLCSTEFYFLNRTSIPLYWISFVHRFECVCEVSYHGYYYLQPIHRRIWCSYMAVTLGHSVSYLFYWWLHPVKTNVTLLPRNFSKIFLLANYASAHAWTETIIIGDSIFTRYYNSCLSALVS